MQHKRILVNVGHALSQNDALRTKVFSGLYIQLEVLWTCVVDPSDDAVVRQFLGSLVNALPTSPDNRNMSAMDVIDLRTNLVNHIISLIGSVPVAAVKTIVDRRQFVHCLREACYIIDILPKVRSGFFALPEVNVRTQRSLQFSLYVCLTKYHVLYFSDSR